MGVRAAGDSRQRVSAGVWLPPITFPSEHELLIRSYRRAPARDQMLQLRRVLMPAQDGPGAYGLLYPTAVPNDSCQRERRQVWVDIGLSAWELARHAVPTTAFAAQRLFALSVSARYRPSQTMPSGTQRARPSIAGRAALPSQNQGSSERQGADSNGERRSRSAKR